MATDNPPVAVPLKEDHNQILSTAGQIVAGLAFIIPAVGYFGTVFSLVLNSRLQPYDTVSLALDHSIPSLAVNGFIAVALTASATWFALPSVSIRFISSVQTDSGPRQKRILALWPLFLIVLLILLFVDFLVVATVFLVLPLPTYFLVKRLKSGQLSFRRLISPIVILTFASTLLVAALFQNLDTGFMRFSKNAGIPNGFYSIVGDEADQIILLPCNSDKSLISVNSKSVLSVKYSSLNSSLFQYGLVQSIRSENWQLPGAQTHCPLSTNGS